MARLVTEKEWRSRCAVVDAASALVVEIYDQAAVGIDSVAAKDLLGALQAPSGIPNESGIRVEVPGPLWAQVATVVRAARDIAHELAAGRSVRRTDLTAETLDGALIAIDFDGAGPRNIPADQKEKQHGQVAS
jgi:hypothetical protein